MAKLTRERWETTPFFSFRFLQSASIPLILQGRDVCGSAITGSGKTAAYGLPLLERLLHRPRNVHATYVLVLVPTRELAVQVHSMLKKLGQLTDVRIALVVGGLSMQQQAISLRSRPDIVVATPNRMIDHLKNTQSVDLDDMSTLVLDEADRLLELGFAEQVKEVISHCPGRRQTLLFSATMTEEVQELIGLSLRNPVRIAADPKHSTPTLLTQEAILLKGQLANKKEAILLSLCDRLFKEKTVIFTRTKQYAHRLKLIFGLTNLQASELHGNMSQTQRLQALEDFRSGHSKYLIATDVASRGLDIIGVQNVISFDEPDVVTTYIHRIGRTARAGKQGRAVTFLDPANRSLIKQIMKYSGKQKLKQRIVSDESIDLWAARIADMAEDIAKIQLEEKEERILQKAEMEVLRAENLMQYDQEIMSRPAKAWFQSTREKRELQKAAREEFDMKGKGKGSAAKKKQQTESSGKGANRQKKQQEVSEGFKSMVRAAKNQEKSLKNKGFGTGKAGDIMLASNERKRKRSKASSSEDRAEEQGFKPRVKKSDKMALNRRQRGNRSVKAFKSKKKYKRR